jgi:hypothetical protein
LPLIAALCSSLTLGSRRSHAFLSDRVYLFEHELLFDGDFSTKVDTFGDRGDAMKLGARTEVVPLVSIVKNS